MVKKTKGTRTWIDLQKELEKTNTFQKFISKETHENIKRFMSVNDIKLSIDSLEWMILRLSKKISEKSQYSMKFCVNRLIGLFLGGLEWKEIDWADTRQYPPTIICEECGMFINKSKNVNKNKKGLPVICKSCADIHFRLHVELSLKFGKKIQGFTEKSLAKKRASLRKVIVKHPNIIGLGVKHGNIQKSIKYERGWKGATEKEVDNRMIIFPDGWAEMKKFSDEFEVVGIWDPMQRRFLSEEEINKLNKKNFGKDKLLK